MTHERRLAIGRDHPALPDHFPGNPVVPGVLVLDEVIETLREQQGAGLVITGLPSVKLSSPLLPEEVLTIAVHTENPETAVFTCRAGTRLVASGSIRFRLPGDRPTGRR